ncbi:MAG: adenosylmethionine--8-amino-7-oxononanoate transaminase [Syntrophobacterales bacterium]|jgi:adenosylmethionine-8-amino-7-oxononanoate aminotransferase|nr:adenosylmethionine--8-amino-7-oxononanoate transaminase [Syntrophobacterales bacterium]
MDKEEIEKLQQADLDCVWHPFTQMKLYGEETTVIIERGKGSWLYDIEGNAYLDGISSLWTNMHGHGKEVLDKALKAQTGLIAHSTLLGISNVPAVRFAQKLLEVAPPGLAKVFYSDSGSTAVEIALKMAFQYHRQSAQGNPRKRKFLTFVNAYHGDTIGSVSLGGIDLFHEMYRDLLFGTYKAASPYCYRCPYDQQYPGCKMDCLEVARKILDEHHDEIAAVVLEPLVQGAAGILVQPDGFVRGVRELCDRYDVFMIADEVAVGFGRTGKMFACQHEWVTPDIMCLAKGISGGYLPLAATLTTEKIFAGFLGEAVENKTFFHGHTYTGNPLACAVAIASLELFAEENIMERVQGSIALLREKLADFQHLSHVGDIRQKGLMAGIELVADKKTKENFPPGKRTGHRVIMEARKRGVIIRPLGDVIVLMPHLGMSPDELELLCRVTYEAIQTVTEKT